MSNGKTPVSDENAKLRESQFPQRLITDLLEVETDFVSLFDQTLTEET